MTTDFGAYTELGSIDSGEVPDWNVGLLSHSFTAWIFTYTFNNLFTNDSSVALSSGDIYITDANTNVHYSAGSWTAVSGASGYYSTNVLPSGTTSLHTPAIFSSTSQVTFGMSGDEVPEESSSPPVNCSIAISRGLTKSLTKSMTNLLT